MAQSTKSRSKTSASRNGSGAKSTSSRSGSTTKRSNARRNGSTGTRSKSTSASRRSGTSSRSGSTKNTAMARTKAAGRAVADAASKAKTPLIAGGTAIAGAAAGAVVKDRLDSSGSKGPLKRLRGVSLPKPPKNLGSKVDLDTVKSVADRMSAYGRQASDIAEAVEKTRKKNK